MSRANARNNNVKGFPNERTMSTQTPQEWANRQATVMRAPTKQELEAALGLSLLSGKAIIIRQKEVSDPVQEANLNPPVDPRARHVWDRPVGMHSTPLRRAPPELSRAPVQSAQPRPVRQSRYEPPPAVITALDRMITQVNNPPQSPWNPFDAAGSSSGPMARHPHQEREPLEQNFPVNSQYRLGMLTPQSMRRPSFGSPSQHPPQQAYISPYSEAESPLAQRAAAQGPATRSRAAPPTKRTPLPSRPLRCDKCERKFASEPDLNRHFSLSQDCTQFWPCDECDATFTGGRWLLAAHMRKVHAAHHCPYCSLKYLKTSGRDSHVRTKHNRCHVCGDYFDRVEDIMRHVKARHGVSVWNGSSRRRGLVDLDEMQTEDEEDVYDEED